MEEREEEIDEEKGRWKREVGDLRKKEKRLRLESIGRRKRERQEEEIEAEMWTK